MDTPTRKMTVQELLSALGSNFFAHGHLMNVASTFQSVLPPNNFVLIAATQKSGSTLLYRALLTLLDDHVENLATFHTGYQEEDLYYPYLIRDTFLRKTICKLHMKANDANIDLLSTFRITPIVLVRRFFDVIPSWRDHWVRELEKGNQILPRPYGERFLSLRMEEQFDYIITHRLPWQIQFFVTWSQTRQDERLEFKWLTYEELNRDPVRAVAAVLDYLGKPRKEERIRDTINSLSGESTRFNKGIIGRGDELLSESQKARIVEMCRFYDWIDFAPVGIPNAVAPQSTAPAMAVA